MKFSRWARSLRSIAALAFLVLGASMPLSADAAGSEVPIACISIGGPVGVDTTWTAAGSPYCVTQNIDVIPGVTLTIQPGVVLKFLPGKTFQVDGTLIATGTAASKITFTSVKASPLPGDWGYIYFSPSSVPASYDSNGTYTGGSILQYATILYSGGAQVSGSVGAGAIQVVSTAPLLDHNVIHKSKADGLDINNAINAKVTYNQFLVNGTNANSGIAVGQSASGQSVVIADNLITATNGYGIYVDSVGVSTVTITGNSVTANTSNGINLSLQSGAIASVDANSINGNQGAGVYSYINGGTGSLIGNTVGGNTNTGIIAHEGCNSTTTITGNLISGNTGGFGGGIYFNDLGGCGIGWISGNTISSNVTTSNGGGIYLTATFGSVSITANTISGNTAGIGGGIFTDNASPATSVNIITNNTATVTNQGGGIYICGGCAPSFSNNDIYGNKSGPTTASVANDVYDGNAAPTFLWAPNNFWGTTNTSVIDSHIYDFLDAGALGVMNYQPILNTTIPLPDLRIGSVSNPPATVLRGKAFSVADAVTNAGAGSASATTVGFYLSPTPTKGTGTVKLGGTSLVINLASGASATGKATPMVSSTMPTGAYYLIACANDNGLVLENNKTNDCRASTTLVTVQ